MFIPDLGSELFPFRIPGQKDSRIRIRIKEFKNLWRELRKKSSKA